MSIEQMNSDRRRRAAVHAALADVGRLRIVDLLALGDASPAELGRELAMPSNLLAHHLKGLEAAGLVVRRRSEGDGRRSYLRLVPETLGTLAPATLSAPRRVVFVCTANSARSQLAAALWQRASDVPATSAGTHPADRIDPAARAIAGRHELPLPEIRPRHFAEVDGGLGEEDLVVTVCDRAHEELSAVREVPDPPAALHWSVPDPVRIGTRAAFETAYDELADRVDVLVSRLSAAS